jgi:hypothetical protein
VKQHPVDAAEPRRVSRSDPPPAVYLRQILLARCSRLQKGHQTPR